MVTDLLKTETTSNFMRLPKWILLIIVLSQFCCTSLWFAGNAVMNEIVQNFHLEESALAHLTSAVQFGFIAGTLVFAFLTIADRFSPSKVFFVCAILGAVFNLGAIWNGNRMESLFFFRFSTGFCLAGIYPVGMKIAADYFQKGLGKSLGYLVGALVVGTAFPHLLKGFTNDFPWRFVLIATSIIASIGGLLMLLLVPDGPYRKASSRPDFTLLFKVFQKRSFRTAAFGYFGHMWELYAFWAFVPVILVNYQSTHPSVNWNIAFWSFLIIGLGGLACVIGGYLSQYFETQKVAFTALLLSCICCLVSPFILSLNLPFVVLLFLIFWGLVVIADSPLFSTLVAQSAVPEHKGTALTIVNCIGFSITIFSIQLLNLLIQWISPTSIYLFLAIGPILGLVALSFSGKNLEPKNSRS